jgi:hypothetical protein
MITMMTIAPKLINMGVFPLVCLGGWKCRRNDTVTGKSLRGRGCAGWDRGGLLGRRLRLFGGGLAGQRIWLRVSPRGTGPACE